MRVIRADGRGHRKNQETPELFERNLYKYVRERLIRMKSTLINDYYLHFNETYFLSRGNSRKNVTQNNDMHSKIKLPGRRLYKGILRTEIFY